MQKEKTDLHISREPVRQCQCPVCGGYCEVYGSETFLQYIDCCNGIFLITALGRSLHG